MFRFLERVGHLLTGAPERSAKTPVSLESLAELATKLRGTLSCTCGACPLPPTQRCSPLEHGGPVYDQLHYGTPPCCGGRGAGCACTHAIVGYIDPKLRELMATVTVNGVFERLCAKRDSTKHTQATTKAAAAIIARFFTDLFPDDAVA
jgi:hypothetical protein